MRIKKIIRHKIPPVVLFILDLVKLVIIAFIIVWPIHRFVFQPFYVVGPSMEPNFYDKEYLIIGKISYYYNEPQRGDVVVFRSPRDQKDYLIKRVIALPEERIRISKGSIYIYNKLLPQGIVLDEEEYLSAGIATPGSIDVRLAKDSYYVLGDNRNASLDSRSFGSVNREYIIGKTWFRGWPVDSIGIIKMPIFAY
ncbi:signal peptidase I [Patescibacteria group bacterium AH-259-L07]|nr:signal peptidase I [Patescibacteria group bacterium AH-259-L07]